MPSVLCFVHSNHPIHRILDPDLSRRLTIGNQSRESLVLRGGGANRDPSSQIGADRTKGQGGIEI